MQEPTSPGDAAGAVRQCPKNRVAVAFVASAATWTRSGVQVRDRELVVGRRVDPSRMADTSGRAPGSGSEGGHLRDGLSRGAGEGRGVCRRPLCVEEAAGLRPSGE